MFIKALVLNWCAMIVHKPFIGGPSNCDQHKKFIFATNEWTYYLAVSVRENAELSTQGGTVLSLKLTVRVKGQRNMRSASKKNFMFPATCENLALRVRKPGQGRKEHK